MVPVVVRTRASVSRSRERSMIPPCPREPISLGSALVVDLSPRSRTPTPLLFFADSESAILLSRTPTPRIFADSESANLLSRTPTPRIIFYRGLRLRESFIADSDSANHFSPTPTPRIFSVEHPILQGGPYLARSLAPSHPRHHIPDRRR